MLHSQNLSHRTLIYFNLPVHVSRYNAQHTIGHQLILMGLINNLDIITPIL